MDIIKAVLLGIIQGITEFLPISSSGHLVVFQNLFGLHQPQLLFDIMVHFGTLMAVFLVFREDIVNIVKELYLYVSNRLKKESPKTSEKSSYNIKLLQFIIIATIPTFIIGYLFEKKVEELFSSLKIVGIMLLVTGLLLWLTKRFSKDDKDIHKMSFKNALVIGFVQGLAILPGISRSGSTIAFGLFQGLEKSLAIRFSFLLSIPAILGAMTLKLGELLHLDYSLMIPNIIGMIVAFLAGYLSLKFLIRIIMKGNFFYFAYYCWLFGLFTLIVPFFLPFSPPPF